MTVPNSMNLPHPHPRNKAIFSPRTLDLQHTRVDGEGNGDGRGPCLEIRAAQTSYSQRLRLVLSYDPMPGGMTKIMVETADVRFSTSA
jgi:hypothetical protein